jgi:hypothetical protein
LKQPSLNLGDSKFIALLCKVDHLSVMGKLHLILKQPSLQKVSKFTPKRVIGLPPGAVFTTPHFIGLIS